MIKLNTNYLDRSYADIKLSNNDYDYWSYNINATSDYYSYFYDNLFSYDKNSNKFTINKENEKNYNLTFSFLALHDSVLLNGLALNNKCTIYKRYVKSTGLGYISWKNWFSQLYLQNENLLDIINQNKLDTSKSQVSQEDIGLLSGLVQNQQSFSYNYLTKELNLNDTTIGFLLQSSYSLNGFNTQDDFKNYLQNNPKEPFVLNNQAIQNLKGYNASTDKNLNITETTNELTYHLNTLHQVLQSTNIEMNINSSFAKTAHTDLFEGRSLISRDLFLNDDIKNMTLPNYNSNYIDINVSKFVDIILNNSNFTLGMDLELTTTQDAVKKLVEEVKEDTTGVLKGIGRIFKGIVKLMPGGKLVTAITDAVAAISGISQGIAQSTKALAGLSSSSNKVPETLQAIMENGIKLARSGKKSVGLVSQASSLADTFNLGSRIGGGISDILGGVTQALHGGVGLYEEGQELAGATNDAGQTSVKYINWNNLTHVIKSESAIKFYENTLSFTFSLGLFGIFNTVEEVIKPCLNLLALVQPSKIDFNKMFGPYFTVESLIMKSGLGDNLSSFARSFLEGNTQIESSVFMKDFWDISIGPGVHFYNCLFDKLNITFSDDKDQNGLPISASCTLHFVSQTPRSILSNYTSQVSFRFGSDINLIDLYNSIPDTIKEFANDSWKNSKLDSDLFIMKNRDTLFLTNTTNNKYGSNSLEGDIDEAIKYRLEFIEGKDFQIWGSKSIETYFYEFNDIDKSQEALIKNDFDMFNLADCAKSYASINKISYSDYSKTPITLALIYPVRKISNNGRTAYINNYKDTSDAALMIFPGDYNNNYISNILKEYNRVNNITSLGVASQSPIQSFFALKHFLNLNNSSSVSISDLTFSVSKYKRNVNEFEKLNVDKNENNYSASTNEYLFQDEDKLDTYENGYAGFYIKTLESRNKGRIYLSDIFIMNDFLESMKNSTKSPNLNYASDLNTTQDKNIFYNENRDKNVKFTFNQKNEVDNGNIFSGYIKREEITDASILATTKCTRFKNIYNSYVYGYKVSPYDPSFLDFYGKTEKDNNTSNETKENNENKEEENKENTEEENKEETTKTEGAVDTSTGKDSGCVKITSDVEPLTILSGKSFSELRRNGLGYALIDPDNNSSQFLSLFKDKYKSQVLQCLKSIKSKYNIPTQENSKYKYDIGYNRTLINNTYYDERLIFSWSINSNYVENNNEG